ncbi:putative polygalacturonase [Forsythia ovata]|uniref:endo-polygalacturonase n=1 Tax=Forsythia ovata TaxID=205694 RepID=A0ABD1P4D9_9LAMI
MGKIRNSSTSNAYSSHSVYSFNYIIPSSICLLLIISNANGFSPIIHFPTPGLFRNTSCPSKTVVFNINDFGAKGDGFTDDTKTLEDVWKVACSLSSRAKIVIPAGKSYLVRPIDFAGPCQSKVTLRISGTIVSPRDPEVWEGLNIHRWLYFHGVKDLIVEGGGLIDGSGHKWWAQSCKMNTSNHCTHAPTAVTFHKCKNLKVRNLTMVSSPQMHMAFTACVRVAASRLSVFAPADSPNTDGIHISASKHVNLKNIIISTGDDCISIVSNSSRIRMKNIVCGPGHGISIGSLGKANSSAAVQDVSLDGAYLFNTENGLRIKTWQGGSGFARNITFQNVWMKNVSNPIIIDQYYCDSSVPCVNQTSSVSIDTVSFHGIRGTSATEVAILFACSDIFPCRRLYLEDIQLTSASGGITRSFCWEAYGKSSGVIHPAPCISSGEIIIGLKVMSNSTSRHKDEYAFL